MFLTNSNLLDFKEKRQTENKGKSWSHDCLDQNEVKSLGISYHLEIIKFHENSKELIKIDGIL